MNNEDYYDPDDDDEPYYEIYFHLSPVWGFFNLNYLTRNGRMWRGYPEDTYTQYDSRL